MTSTKHVSVLQQAAVQALQIREDGKYIDATYGRGGHSKKILEQLGSQGRLTAIDRDPEAIADAERQFEKDQRFAIVGANFGELDQVINPDWLGKVDGLLLDLGVSSPQLDVAERGFGFSRDGSLDMRMDPLNGVSAAQWLADVREEDLVYVFKTYGEERYARRIAAAVIAARDSAPITRTLQLAEIIKAAHPRWEKHHHPATRCFQAIRIHINGELDAVKQVLACAPKVLKKGGRLVVISFHSLEDRLVKRALRNPPPPAGLPRHLPLPEMAPHPWKVISKAIKASDEEVAANPRARSAVMRIAERVV